MPPPTNIKPLLSTKRTHEINTNNNNYSYDTSNYYYVDSDSEDISKSFICSSLNKSFRKKTSNKTNDTKLYHEKKSLNSKEDRMNLLSKYASDHNKTIDPSVLDLTHRNELDNPEMLRYGLTPDVASQIYELRVHNSIIEEGCGWPHFLDVISTLLVNLRHVQCWYPDDVKPYYEDCITFEQKRMLRLYIVYRLPDLQSINEEYVTEEERRLARPCTPSGIQVKRDDWCTGSMVGYAQYNTDDACSITDSTSTTSFYDDDIQDEIGVEIIANHSSKILEFEIEEQEDEEIMEMVHNVLVNKDVMEDDNIILENDTIEIVNDQSKLLQDEKECSYISFRSNVVSPSPTHRRPPKHPSRRRCSNTSSSGERKKSFKYSSNSSSIIDQSSSSDSSVSGDDEYWI